MEEVEVWIARNALGELCMFGSKPTKDTGLWVSMDLNRRYIPNEWFPNIKWSDKTPTKAKITLMK